MGVDAAGRSSSRESELIRASAKSAADPTARRRRVRLLREVAKLKRRLKRPPRQSEPKIIIRPVIPCFLGDRPHFRSIIE